MDRMIPVEIWTCPNCEWSGPESELAGDYYGTTEVPGGSVGCNTVCPACGEWLRAKENRRVEVEPEPEGEGGR